MGKMIVCHNASELILKDMKKIGSYLSTKETATLEARILNHWQRMTHICISKLTIISSDNGL